jgi:hypothetical protein
VEQSQKYHTGGTIPKIPHWWNNPKNTTLVEQSQKYHTGVFHQCGIYCLLFILLCFLWVPIYSQIYSWGHLY